MLLFFRRPCVGTRVRACPYEGLRSPTVTVTESFVLRPLLKTEGADYVIYLYMHCNFICGLSDVVIKTFSQSINHTTIVSLPDVRIGRLEQKYVFS